MTEPVETTARRVRLLHAELVRLLFLGAIAIVCFFATRIVASGVKTMRVRDAAEWFARAQHARQDGDQAATLTMLRKALVRNPTSTAYRLALAEALADARQDEAAEQQLLAIRETLPEDPDVSVQLARLAVKRGDLDAARRYYESALNALWQPAAMPRRTELRTELINLLLDHGEPARALSELLTLAAGTPEVAPAKVATARLFLKAGQPQQAYTTFIDALRIDPANRDAAAGAGEAAFAIGNFAAARKYLAGAVDPTGHLAAERQLAGLVIDADPLAPRLPITERRRRLAAAMSRADERASQCPAIGADDADRTELTALSGRLGKIQDTSDVEHALDVLYRLERRAADCAEPTPLDRALLIIGRRHGSEPQ